MAVPAGSSPLAVVTVFTATAFCSGMVQQQGTDSCNDSYQRDYVATEISGCLWSAWAHARMLTSEKDGEFWPI